MPRPLDPANSSRATHPSLETDARAWSNGLAEVPLFASLNGRHLRKVAGAGRIKRIHGGTAIVQTGEPGDSLYAILDGEVSVRRPGLGSL